jgi:hypothetical protein
MNTKDLVLAIFVVATLVFAALTVNEYTRGQATSTSTIVSTTTLVSSSAVFNYSKMPTNFTLGQYSFSVGPCTACIAATGALVDFTVSYQGQSQMLRFGFPAVPPPNNPNNFNEPPAPSTASAFGGGVVVNWFENNDTLYVSVLVTS